MKTCFFEINSDKLFDILSCVIVCLYLHNMKNFMNYTGHVTSDLSINPDDGHSQSIIH